MIKKIASLCVVFALIVACSSNDDSNNSIIGLSDDGFDRSSLLVNWADNIIIPAYTDLDAKLTILKTNKNTFISAPNQTNLEVLRASWLEAYKVWQHVEMFNIGKAEEINYNFQMNVYPTTIADVESNIQSGTYDLTSVNNNDAVGFPAVDYLLYGVAQDDASILAKYTNTNYQNYLSDVINRMQSLTATVLNDWTTNYRTIFVTLTGNTATSSVNKMVNDFIFYYEKGLRANKIGIPAGVFSSGETFNEKVEGFYSKDFSKELALKALNASQDFFNGKSYTSSNTNNSFSSYLTYLNRTDIVSTITERFNAARIQINTLNNNLSQQVISNNTEMTETFDALQLVVIPLKVDMVQAMNISIDFVDADGD